MTHATWDKVVSHQGKSITVPAVSGHRCSECGEAVYDDESYDRVVTVGDGLVRALRKTNPPHSLDYHPGKPDQRVVERVFDADGIENIFQ
ncbi:MAG: type II toxin-antitoxin system MqsA family antitoxin [Magnetococcales bacterium]|nr:type II toxin-antitoxin system MqsA family antitoxin [Magnetococcales bacterium]